MTDPTCFVSPDELRRYVGKRFGLSDTDVAGYVREVKRLLHMVRQLRRAGDRDAVRRLVAEIKDSAE